LIAIVKVTSHGTARTRQRCGIKKKSVQRIAAIAFKKGISIKDTTGSLNRYLQYLYHYNETADNIRIYGDKVYIFCGNVLVTVLNVPHKYKNRVNMLMRERKHEEEYKKEANSY